MRRRQGPPWGALLGLDDSRRSYQILRDTALGVVRAALDQGSCLPAAAKSLGVTTKGLHRLSEDHRQLLCEHYERCAKRSEALRLQRRWPPGRELSQTPAAKKMRAKRKTGNKNQNPLSVRP